MHLIQRGHDRRAIFGGPEDRHIAMRYIAEAVAKCRVELHAYVLMDNHVHLLATGLEDGAVSRFMQQWSRRYARYFNRRRQRSGSLYESRFHDFVVVEPGYLLRCMRYIEQNPVRARICSHPGNFPWSSYDQNSRGQPNLLLTAHPIYMALGETSAERARSYRAWIAVATPDEELEFFRAGMRARPVGRPKKTRN